MLVYCWDIKKERDNMLKICYKCHSKTFAVQNLSDGDAIQQQSLSLVKEADKIRPSTFEPACNPVAQAKLMNRSNTDMNIIVGLCVGHDMIFTKYSDAPVTTLVVKDRVTGHNPVSVLYGQNFYYKRLQTHQIDVGEDPG